jgi:hypothetical protein
MLRKQGLFHKRSYKESQNVVVKESHQVSVKITSVGSLSLKKGQMSSKILFLKSLYEDDLLPFLLVSLNTPSVERFVASAMEL